MCRLQALITGVAVVDDGVGATATAKMTTSALSLCHAGTRGLPRKEQRLHLTRRCPPRKYIIDVRDPSLRFRDRFCGRAGCAFEVLSRKVRAHIDRPVSKVLHLVVGLVLGHGQRMAWVIARGLHGAGDDAACRPGVTMSGRDRRKHNDNHV